MFRRRGCLDFAPPSSSPPQIFQPLLQERRGLATGKPRRTWQRQQRHHQPQLQQTTDPLRKKQNFEKELQTYEERIKKQKEEVEIISDETEILLRNFTVFVMGSAFLGAVIYKIVEHYEEESAIDGKQRMEEIKETLEVIE